MRFWKKKENTIDNLFIEQLDNYKNNNIINDNLYYFIINNFNNDLNYFNSNVIYQNNKTLFYKIYINYKIICTSHNYLKDFEEINNLCLIYYSDLYEDEELLILINNMFFKLLENKENKDLYEDIIYKLRILFINNDYLLEVIKEINNIDNQEIINKIINDSLTLKKYINEENILEIVITLIQNIDNKNFNYDKFFETLKSNFNIIHADDSLVNNCKDTFEDLINTVNDNLDKYYQLFSKIEELENKYNIKISDIDKDLGDSYKRIKRNQG